MKKAFCALAVLLSIVLLPWMTMSNARGEAAAQRIPMTVTVPQDRESDAFLLTDGYAETYMLFRRESTVRVTFEAPVCRLVTVWETEPTYVTLRCYAGDTLLSDDALEVPYLSTVTELPRGTTAVELLLGKRSEVHLSEIYAYGEGDLPESEYQWQPVATEPDVLLMVAYPGDEYRFFGGLLPKLINDGANVAVCYCADHSRARLEEGFRTLWDLGIRSYPIQLHIKSRLNLDYKYLGEWWRKARADKLLGDCIRSVAPSIVVVPSDVETAAPEARLVAEYAALACTENGPVQKLYVASPDASATVLADELLPYYDNQSANAVAETAMRAFHTAAFQEYPIYTDGAYRLAFSKVGADEQRNSLTEHLSVSLHPSVTATPVPTDTPEPTEVPTDTPVPTEAPTPTAAQTEAPTEAPEQKRGLFSCAGKEETPVPTEAPTPVPSAEPTEAPTPEAILLATPEPTEEPTPEPTEVPDEHYLPDGEPEQIVEDRENGYWSFRDQSTHIEIHRYEGVDLEEEIQVWFVAHIWMRDNQHRSGFGNEGRTGRTSEKPYRIARRYGAVLLITGDNIINMDVELKGVLMRDGQVYSTRRTADMMAWNDRELTFDLFEKGTIGVEELKERGYREVYSFGPILMKDGQVIEGLNNTRLGTKNPRVGVGMVEPGHFVVIVADGRQADYAIGYRLEEFAQLFQNEGCVSAYNLDGGVSAAMVFMGEHLNTHMNFKDRSMQRNLPDGLLFGHTFLLPDELAAPPEHDGIREDVNIQQYVGPH